MVRVRASTLAAISEPRRFTVATSPVRRGRTARPRAIGRYPEALRCKHFGGSVTTLRRRRGGRMGGFPDEGMELTHLLVVADAIRSRDFYRDVLGAELYREYGAT